MTNLTQWVNVLTTDRALGDAMAGLIGADADVGDAQTFTKGRRLRALHGSADVVAWGASMAASPATVARIAEFNGPGPWPMLNALGASDALIAQAKGAIRVEAGPRAAYFDRTLTYWAAHGYAPVNETVP